MSARHCYREMRYIQQLGLDLWQSGKTVCQEFSRGRTLDLVSFTRVLAVLAASESPELMTAVSPTCLRVQRWY